MQLIADRLILSASDLINFLECEHLTRLDVEVMEGRLEASPARNDTAELVARKGDEHEQRHLQALRDQFGSELIEVDTRPDPADLQTAAETTRAAMTAGAPVIYQATFLSGRWRGHADFLERVAQPSELGDWSYEVVDTKLARSVKPYFVVQLCLYSEFVAEIQGLAPVEMHVILGTGERRTLRVNDFAAYYRRMKAKYSERLRHGLADTYPEPVPHCGLCRWSDLCDSRRIADDHLSLVARMGRPQATKLKAAGVSTAS